MVNSVVVDFTNTAFSRTGAGVPAVSGHFAQVLRRGITTVHVNHQIAQASYRPPSARDVRHTQAAMQAVVTGQPIPAISHVAVMVAYRTTVPDRLELRAWSFTLDGHEFYVVTLGEEGTWVYDFTTGQWCHWQTAGISSWNMEVGVVWKGMVVAGDRLNAQIWRLAPETFLDDGFKNQIRRVTGSLSVRNRTFVPNYAFRVTVSPGDPEVANTIPVRQPTLTLRYSDDQGNTYVSAGSVLLEEGNFTQYPQWLSLGLIGPPQRVYELSDEGAVARISGADAEIEGEEQ